MALDDWMHVGVQAVNLRDTTFKVLFTRKAALVSQPLNMVQTCKAAFFSPELSFCILCATQNFLGQIFAILVL